MNKKRRQFSTKFKFQIGLEALKETRPVNEIASQYDVHPTQVKQWKRQLREEGPAIFGRSNTKDQQEQEKLEEELYAQIGRLKMEIECTQGVPEKKSAQFS